MGIATSGATGNAAASSVSVRLGVQTRSTGLRPLPNCGDAVVVGVRVALEAAQTRDNVEALTAGCAGVTSAVGAGAVATIPSYISDTTHRFGSGGLDQAAKASAATSTAALLAAATTVAGRGATVRRPGGDSATARLRDIGCGAVGTAEPVVALVDAADSPAVVVGAGSTPAGRVHGIVDSTEDASAGSATPVTASMTAASLSGKNKKKTR
jgi:hypothetical protein